MMLLLTRYASFDFCQLGLTLNAVYPVCHEDPSRGQRSADHLEELDLSFSMRSESERVAGRTKSK